MINNRLFKKINAIFWALLTWLPLVLLILASIFREVSFQFDVTEDFFNQNFSRYFVDFFTGAQLVLSNADDFWYNPLSDIFKNIFSGILDTVGSGQYYYSLVDMASWVCWVQVVRLFVYVFYWFIDLISGLFDLMTFNRKGDN